MSLSNRSVSNSPTPSILLKARRFGIFSIFTVTAIIANPLLAKAQIAVDGSTATEVKGNAIAPVDKGTINGGNLYHSFDKFNVPNSGVIFNTGNSSVDGTKVNNIINRVTGDTPSSILGTIQSRSAFPNANLYLLNPNGVVFGANARLDIGGSFNVTTGTSLGFDQNQKFSVDKNSLSFPTGDPKNIQFAIAQPAAIINQGNLSVDAGKNISLTAGTVINTGNLTAPNGNINLAAVLGNSQVELRSPDTVLGFEVNKDVIPSNWNGTIATLPKLAELLTGKASQANQVVVKPDGTISLVANPNTSDIAVRDGMNITSGKIDVSSSTGKGGNVGIFGNQVGLVNSLIDASGINGGGTVLIGGDFQGKGIAPNALQTYVDASSKILANGLLVGDGGKVIVWSDRSTQFFGAIAAKGGDVSGNGGFVEVSGKENLDYRGSTNTLAPHGKIGTLLLDPTNITIIDSTGNAALTDVKAFANSPTNALLNNLTINAATANVLLQATNDITFNANINITAAGVGLTAQAGNSIISDGFGNGTITTNGGNVSLTANDPASATGTGNITLGGNITTNGGNINLTINNAGRLLIASTAQLKSGTGNITLESKTTTSTNSGISINGNVVGATPSTGSILIDASSTNLDAVSFGANAQVISNAGSITINGTSATANGIISIDGVRIESTTGAIALTGISNGGTGDGVVIQGGNTIAITNNGSNISISGNAANSTRTGLNITGTALSINSGTGNMTFTSDRSIFPQVSLGGTGTLTLQPFTSNAALTINGTVTNVSNSAANVFLDQSFLKTLVLSNFGNVVIGNVSSNNAIALVNSLSINSNSAPISILTNRTFNANSNSITTNTAALTLTANQGITNLGNITTAGGNINISSETGNISTATTSNINASSTDTNGGNISISATNNGSLSLQNLDSSTTFATAGSSAGNITLTVSGANNISVGNVIANRIAANNGNAGTISFSMGTGTGNITLTGTSIESKANSGKGSSILFPNPVIISASSPTVGLSVNANGTTSSGNITFNNTVTSPNGSLLSVTTSTGNITFNSIVGLSTAPLGDLLLLTNNNTNTFANTVFANSITANQGLTVINANIVATGINSGISLGNFTLNGDISLVGNEINLTGTGTNTASGNITLKPFTTSQAIAIGGTGDTGTGTLDLLATDISKFSAGGSLTIGHESGTGAISFEGATTFNRPTTVRSPVGAGNVTINNNITATGNLTVQAGNAIAITNNAQITSSSGALSVILNSGKISIASGSLINSNGGDIVFGGGTSPLTTPAIFASFADSGVTINGTVNAVGGNITLNGSNVFNASGNNVGVHISNGGQVLTNGTGNITITGTGGTGFTNNQGIEILGTNSLVQSANGNVTLTGTTGGSSSNNDGIRITDSAIVRTTGTGNLELTGTSNATGTNGTGILMAGATLAATGTGNITLKGTSGTGTSSNAGISLGNTTSLTGQVNTSSGNILLTGISRGITNNNQGVLLGGNITVTANGNGNVNVTGTGANGGSSNIGILLSFASSSINVRNGNLSLNGTGQGTGTGNDGVFLSSGVVDATGIGNITFTGAAPSGSFGINLSDASIKPSNTNGNLTLIANEMDATGTTNSIKGTGNLFIEPATATRNIIVGGASNASDANLEINDTLLAGLQTGFTQVFIGRSDSSGLISLGSDVVFNNPVTLRSPSTFSVFAGAINTSGFSFTNAGSVTFLANRDITTGNITAAGNAIALTSTNGAINTSAGRISTATSSGNAGSITFQASGDITTGAGTTPNPAISSFISTGGTGSPNSISFTSKNGAINTSLGDIDAGGGNITFVARNNIITSGVFSRAVNGGTISLTSQAGAVNTSAGDITTTTTNVRGTGGNITLTANGNVTTKGVFATGDNGKIEIKSTTGGIDTTTGASSLESIGSNNSITLTAQQNIVTRDILASGNQTSLSITSSAGLINTSLGTLDTSSTATNGKGGNITVSSTGTTIGNLNTSSSSGNAGAIAFSSGNITIAGSDINTSSVSGTAANLNFAFPVILNTSTLTINTDSTSGTSGNVTFTGNLNGTTANANNLVINAEGGALNFNGAIGNNIPLGNITLTTSGTTTFNSVNASDLKTINGGTVLLLGNVTSKGNQEYNGAVFFAPNITLNSSSGNGNITFNGAIANNVSGTPSNLILNAGTGDIAINKGAGSSGDRFGNITVTNAGNFSTGAGRSILANSFTQLAGTGTTSFGGNPDNFSGDLIVTTNNFSVDELATLQAGNISITALGNATSSNGFSGSPNSTLQVRSWG